MKTIAKDGFGDIVKGAVDIKKEIMALSGEIQIDKLNLLIEKENSSHRNVWGINLYPEKENEAFIEFDSMINLKPSFGNRTRGVENPQIRQKIIAIVNNLIK